MTIYIYQIWCYPKKPISHQITDGYDLSVVTFSFISNTKPMITNIWCKLKLDIVFRVRYGSPDYCFVGPIRKQRTDFQSCKSGPTSCACLALGTRLGCYGKNKHFCLNYLQTSKFYMHTQYYLDSDDIYIGASESRAMTCRFFVFNQHGDSSQPITTLSPTIMRRVAIRYELRPTLCDWCETARSPSQSSCRQTSYGSIARSFSVRRAKLSVIFIVTEWRR